MTKKKTAKKPTKRGALSKSEKFYIVHNPDALSVDELAKEVNRSSVQVQKVVDENPVIEEAKLENPERPKTMFMQTMGTHKRNGKPTAAVMTRAASEHADEARKTNRVKAGSKTQDAIHRPRG